MALHTDVKLVDIDSHHMLIISNKKNLLRSESRIIFFIIDGILINKVDFNSTKLSNKQ